MFGRKICLEYYGLRRQCSNCYGNHPKKYCRSERVGFENFVKGFSKRYSHVPSSLYGKFLILAPAPVSAPATASATPVLPTTTSTISSVPRPPTVMAANSSAAVSAAPPAPQTKPKIVIALKRGNGNDWSPKEGSTVPDEALHHQGRADPAVANSVVEKVSSFLNGIRASFRQDNVIVPSNQHLSKGSAATNPNHGK